MKKTLPGLMAAAILLGGTPASTLAESNSNVTNVTVEIDGQALSLDQPPIIINGRVLVPLRGVLEKLGATVSWDSQTRTVTVTKGTKNIQIAIDSSFAVINGYRYKMDEPAHLINDRAMVPLRFISEALGAEVQWDNTHRTALISTTGFFSSGNDNNGTNSTAISQPLTYAKALEMAMTNSYPLKESQASIDRAKEVLDHVSDNVKYVPASGGNTIATKAYTSYAQANINYFSAKKALEYTQDSLTYAVKQAYNAVLQAQEQKALADVALKNAQVQLQVAAMNQQYGTLSDLDYQQKQQAYNQAQSNQAAAEKAIQDAYQKLNQLLGLPKDARPQLIDEPSYTKLGQIDLQAKVSQAESESPILWQINQKINLAQLGLKLYTFNDPTNPDPYQAKEIDVDLATYNAADQKDQLDKTVRTLYYEIQQLEDQYNSLQAQLVSAQTTLSKTQALYDNGMATQADLVAAQLGVESIKKQIFDLTVQHDNLMQAFSTPWIINGASATATSGNGSTG